MLYIELNKQKIILKHQIETDMGGNSLPLCKMRFGFCFSANFYNKQNYN